MEVNNNLVKRSKVKVSKWAGLSDYIYPVCVGLIAALCYINSLNGNFVHDDIYAIKNNPDVNGLSDWTEMFSNDFWGKPMHDNTSHKSYRPLTIATFRLNYFLSGDHPKWFHIVNVILHSTVTLLFTMMCRTIFRLPRETCIIIGLLFAVHPVHSEAVAGIVGRAELLSATFFLSAIFCYVKSIKVDYSNESPDFPATQNPIFLVAMVICSVLAMLSKEQSLTVLGICGLFDVVIFCKKGMKRLLLERSEAAVLRMHPLLGRLLVLVSTLTCLILFRIWVMSGQFPQFLEQDNPASFSTSLSIRALTYNYLFAFNSWLLLSPTVLCYDWTYGSIPLVESWSDTRNLATGALYVTLIFIGYKCFQELKTHTSNGPSIILVGLILTLVPFLPASNLFFRIGFVVAERILYLPSIGFCLLVGYGLSLLLRRFGEYRRHMLVAFIAYLAVLGAKTWSQNAVWMSREVLFRSGVKTLPNNAKVHYNYANYLKDTGSTDDAIWHYKTSLRLHADQASVYNNMGTLTSNQSEAEVFYQRALQLHPNHKGAFINLGQLVFNSGRREEGVALVQRSLDIDPHNSDALLTMGKMMMDEGRMMDAEHFIKMAITEKPLFAKAYNYYGVFLLKQGHIEDAVTSYQRAYQLDIHDTVAMSNAADGLRQLGRMDEAEQVLWRSHTIKPDDKTLDQLGLLYLRNGQTSEAVSVYEQLVANTPNNTEIIIHYISALIKEHQLAKAEIYTMRVLSHQPTHTEGLRTASNIASLTARPKEALYYMHEALKQALAQNRDASYRSMLTYDLGNLYKDLKQMDKAAQYYHETIILDPSKSKAHLNLGAIYHLEGKFSEAQRQYEDVLKLDPNDQLVKENLAKLARLQKQQTNSPKHGRR